MSTPQKHKLTAGDTRTPLTARLRQDGRAVDVDGLTVAFRMVDDAGNAKVDNDSSHTAQAQAVAFTVDTATNEIISTGHGLIVGDEIVLTTTSTLPTGLAASTIYFVRSVTLNRFTVSLESGGPAVDISTSGSGTHSYRALGHVQYAFQATDVDGLDADSEPLEPGDMREYRAWFVVTDNGASDHFPSQSIAAPQFVVQVYNNA